MRAVFRHKEHDELDEGFWEGESDQDEESERDEEDEFEEAFKSLEEQLEIGSILEVDEDAEDYLEDEETEELDDLVLPQDSKELGKLGEAVAARFLEQRGYEILERNWSCTFGEADIIARDEDCLVFVEVKTRRGIKAGLPEDAVTREKRRKYEGIALCYLNEYEDASCNVRFDVVAMALIGGSRAFLRHHINAFTCEDF